MLTDYQDFAILLSYQHDYTLADKELVKAALVLHRDFLTVAALPEASLTVFQHLVEIPVTATRRVTIGNLYQRIALQTIQASTRRTYQEFATLALHDGNDARGLPVGERIAHKTVGGIVVTYKTHARANPQLAFLVTIQLGDGLTRQSGRVGLLRIIGHETITVIPVQTVLRCYPDKTVLILTDIIDESTRKTFRGDEESSLSETKDRNQRNGEE